MKQIPIFSPVQKVMMFVLTVLVFGFAAFNPHSRSEGKVENSNEREVYEAVDFVKSIPVLPSATEPHLKLNLVLFDLYRFWSLLLVLTALVIQQCQSSLKLFFIQKINFVFVSTQAP